MEYTVTCKHNRLVNRNRYLLKSSDIFNNFNLKGDNLKFLDSKSLCILDFRLRF